MDTRRICELDKSRCCRPLRFRNGLEMGSLSPAKPAIQSDYMEESNYYNIILEK